MGNQPNNREEGAEKAGEERKVETGRCEETENDAIALITWLKTFTQSANLEREESEYLNCLGGDADFASIVFKITKEIYEVDFGDNDISAQPSEEMIWVIICAITGTEKCRTVPDRSRKIGLLSELLLEAVHCSRKKEYIERILRLHDQISKSLMQIIDRKKSIPFTPANTSSPVSSPTPSSTTSTQQPESTPNQSPPSLSANAPSFFLSLDIDERIRSLQKQLHTQRTKNKKLSSELNQYISNETKFSQKLNALKGKHRSQLLVVETSSIHQIQELKAEKDALQTKIDRDISDYQKQIESYRETVSVLRDELDVLRHKEHKLTTAENRYKKCKDCVETLLEENKELHQRLRYQEEAHNKSKEACRNYEKELNALKCIKEQSEEYQNSAKEMKDQLDEVQDELSRTKNQAEQYKQELNELKNQNEALNRELQSIYLSGIYNEQGDDFKSIGVGITEFNPEVQEKLNRLENENKRLKEIVSDPENCNTVGTKSLLEAQKLELQERIQREDKLKKKLQDLKQKCDGLQQTMEKKEEFQRREKIHTKNVEQLVIDHKRNESKKKYNQQTKKHEKLIEATNLKLKKSVEEEKRLKSDIQEKEKKIVALEKTMKTQKEQAEKDLTCTKQTLEYTCLTLQQTQQTLYDTRTNLKNTEEREKVLEATNLQLKESVEKEKHLKSEIQEKEEKIAVLEKTMDTHEKNLKNKNQQYLEIKSELEEVKKDNPFWEEDFGGLNKKQRNNKRRLKQFIREKSKERKENMKDCPFVDKMIKETFPVFYKDLAKEKLPSSYETIKFIVQRKGEGPPAKRHTTAPFKQESKKLKTTSV